MKTKEEIIDPHIYRVTKDGTKLIEYNDAKMCMETYASQSKCRIEELEKEVGQLRKDEHDDDAIINPIMDKFEKDLHQFMMRFGKMAVKKIRKELRQPLPEKPQQ